MRPPRRSLRRSDARDIVPDRIRFRSCGDGCAVFGAGVCRVFAGCLSGVCRVSEGCLPGAGGVSVRRRPGVCRCLPERRWRSATALSLRCCYARCFFGACSRAAASVRPLWLGFPCGRFAGAVPPRLLLWIRLRCRFCAAGGVAVCRGTTPRRAPRRCRSLLRCSEAASRCVRYRI